MASAASVACATKRLAPARRSVSRTAARSSPKPIADHSIIAGSSKRPASSAVAANSSGSRLG